MQSRYFRSKDESSLEARFNEQQVQVTDVTNNCQQIAQQYGNRFVQSLRHRLVWGQQPVNLLCQSDSTTNDPTEWFYKAAQWLGEKYQAYTVKYRLWNDTTQAFDFPTLLQAGAAGDAYITISGSSGSSISTTDKAQLDITGDIEIVAKVALNDYFSLKPKSLVSKFGDAGNRGYDLAVTSNGYLYLWYSTDGTANATALSKAALPVANGAPIWIKVTADVDNGDGGADINFYYGSDGVSWTKLGGTVVVASTISFFANNSPLYFGSRAGADLWAGKYYYACIKNGIDGKIVASMDAGMAFPVGTKTFSDAEGNTYTINGTSAGGNGSPLLIAHNASRAGATIAYGTDATRLAAMANLEPQLCFIAYSHNEGANIAYDDEYEALATALLTKHPKTGIVFVAQNPQQAPEANIIPHAIRCGQIVQSGAKNNYGIVDVFTAFQKTGDISAYLVDGCHPNAAGTELYLEEVKKFLLPLTV